MKLLKCVLVGGALVAASQAFAGEDTASEIRLLKAKLKQPEQRVEVQGQREKRFEAQAAWDPRLGPYHLHIEAWGLYRQFFDRFNFANHTFDTGSFGGHINAELIPKTLDLQVYGAHGALGRFTSSPFPDATVAQDGTIPAVDDHVGDGGVDLAHTADARHLQLRRIGKNRRGVRECRHRAVRLWQPALQQHRLQRREFPAATCNGNTREVRQITAGFYDTIYQGAYGTVKAGVQYSYNQRLTFVGVGGAPRTDDSIVMSQIRYCPF